MTTRTDETVRKDLIGALAASVAEKGYASTTIADIVALARCSKRTFYEHFGSKEECLLACYSQVTRGLMRAIAGAGGSFDRDWHELVSQGAATFLSALDSMPEFSRTMLIEMQGAGPRAFRMRQETLRGFAATIAQMVEAGRPANPGLGTLTTDQALAMVGGVHELLLQAIDPYVVASKSERPFSALHGDVVRLISAILSYDPLPRR